MKAIITAALLAASGTLSAQCFQKVVAGERYFDRYGDGAKIQRGSLASIPSSTSLRLFKLAPISGRIFPQESITL